MVLYSSTNKNTSYFIIFITVDFIKFPYGSTTRSTKRFSHQFSRLSLDDATCSKTE